MSFPRENQFLGFKEREAIGLAATGEQLSYLEATPKIVRGSTKTQQTFDPISQRILADSKSSATGIWSMLAALAEIETYGERYTSLNS